MSQKDRKLLDILNKIIMIGFFGEVCVSFWKEITVTVNFLLLMLKCLKFNCFMLQDQNIKGQLLNGV